MITYEVEFSEAQQDILQAESVFWPTCQQTDCSLSDAVEMLYNSTNSILMSNDRTFNASVRMETHNTSRKVRAIEVFGDFLHFCCSVATDGELHKLEFNEQKVTDHLNAFQGLVSDDHKDLVKITRNLRQFAGNFSHQFHDAYSKLTDNVKLMIQQNQSEEDTRIMNQLLIYIFHLYSHVNILSRQEFINSAREHCDKKLITSSLVHPNLLRADLYRLEKGFKSKGYQLAIPLSDLKCYFNLPLTTCVIKENSMVLSLKVPLTSITGRYQLYQYIQTPMYFDGQSCQLRQRDLVLARRWEDGEVQVIAGNHLSSCQPQTDFLCYLPRQLRDGHLSSKCMDHMLTSPELKNIQRFCELSCHPADEEMEIVEYSPTEYIVSNIQENTTIICEGGTSHLLQRVPGALYVSLPCNCAIKVGGRVVIRHTFPCDSKISIYPTTQHFLPLHWVKFNSLKIDVLKPHLNPKFSNYSEILKDDIDIKVPELFVHDRVSSDIFQKIELPNSWNSIINSSSFVYYILFGWLILLSLFCLYLTMKLYILKLNSFTAQQPTIQIVDK